MISNQAAKIARFTNVLLLQYDLRLQDVCQVPEDCWYLLEPVGRDGEECIEIRFRDAVSGGAAPEVIRRLANFFVRVREWERTLSSEIYVLSQLVRHEGKVAQSWVRSSQDARKWDGRCCAVFAKWAMAEEREAEMHAWVQEAEDLAQIAGEMLMHGSTAVELGGVGGVRRRRVYEAQL